jgi:hypothetical protein
MRQHPEARAWFSQLRSASRRTAAGTFQRRFLEIGTELARPGSPIQLIPLIVATDRFGRAPVVLRSYPRASVIRDRLCRAPASSLRLKLIIKKRSLRDQNDVILLLIVLSTRDRWIFLNPATVRTSSPDCSSDLTSIGLGFPFSR